MNSRRVVRDCSLFAFLVSVIFSLPPLSISAAEGVSITRKKDRLVIDIDGSPFTEYHIGGPFRPYFYPVRWLDGAGLTRNFPMVEGVEGEEDDHVHHRGVWFGHRRVNGMNFWGEGKDACKMVHDGFVSLKHGPDSALFRHRTKWISREGKHVASDERTVRIHRDKDIRRLDFQVTVFADQGDITLGDDKDAGMATRVPHTMKVAYRNKKPSKGRLVNSEGHRDGDCWGKAARWLDNHGDVEGQHLGVAIFDHPDNPRYPTWWHARTYGLLSANAFGKRHFEGLKDKAAGDMFIPKGESRTWKYRFIWHQGDEKEGRVEERWQEFAKE